MPAHPRIGKAELIELIRLGYAHGIGPRVLATLTGYSRRTIHVYAATLGLSLPTTRPKAPAEFPVEFMVAMARAGLARKTLVQSSAS